MPRFPTITVRRTSLERQYAHHLIAKVVDKMNRKGVEVNVVTTFKSLVYCGDYDQILRFCKEYVNIV